jgi:hypothetical protein
VLLAADVGASVSITSAVVAAIVALLGVLGYQNRRARLSAVRGAFNDVVTGLASDDTRQQLAAAVFLRRFFDSSSELGVRTSSAAGGARIRARRFRGTLSAPRPRRHDGRAVRALPVAPGRRGVLGTGALYRSARSCTFPHTGRRETIRPRSFSERERSGGESRLAQRCCGAAGGRRRGRSLVRG